MTPCHESHTRGPGVEDLLAEEGERRRRIAEELMPTQEQMFCPNRDCLDGDVWRACEHCGRGVVPGMTFEEAAVALAALQDDCAKCGGAGEYSEGACHVCEGRRVVSRAFGYLYEADQWVRIHVPEWEGGNQTRPGITLFSKADYYRLRAFVRPRVTSACGCFLPTPDPEGYFGDRHLERPVTPVVQLLDGGGGIVLSLWGFAWGYGGEGPHGLGAVLADAFPAAFPTYQAAMEYVVGRPQGQGWALP